MQSVSQLLDLAIKHHQAGNFQQAEVLYRQILQIDPQHVDALHLYGLIAKQFGRNDVALEYIQQALRLNPNFAGAHVSLGLVLRDLGRLAEAIAHLQRATQLQPDFAAAYINLGVALQEQGKLPESITSYQQALRLQPDSPDAHNNLGIVLRNSGRLDEAIAHYREAIRHKPDYTEAHNNLAIVMQDQGKLDEAVVHCREALRLNPAFAAGHNNLGHILKDLGRLDEAISGYQEALRLQPGFITAHDNLLVVLPYHPAYDSAAILEEARRWNDQRAAALAASRRPHENSVDPDRRLRIGYVSPDLRHHPVAYLLLPLLSNHDHGQVEIFCYAEVAQPDDMTERLRGCADVWRSTMGLTDEQVADMVRADRIDILVDLALHLARNRLMVFARKPAPVQVTWMVPGTTGLSTMDYRLTDPWFDPPGEHDSWYSEQSVHLADAFWCYDPVSDQPPVQELPALANGFVTFGCLNNFCKVNDGTLVLWARVLRAVPRSRLLLLAPRGQAREHVLAILRQEGIDEPRVEFTERQPRQKYLELYNRIDLGLDLLPYNGHTTSYDAFWMGVPTITLIGKTVVGRAGWSLLCNLGLQELAARTPEEFVALAADLAGDLARLRELRQTARPRMVRSPLMDAPRFVRNMERVLRQMWHAWCRRFQASGGR